MLVRYPLDTIGAENPIGVELKAVEDWNVLPNGDEVENGMDVVGWPKAGAARLDMVNGEGVGLMGDGAKENGVWGALRLNGVTVGENIREGEDKHNKHTPGCIANKNRMIHHNGFDLVYFCLVGTSFKSNLSCSCS